MDLWMFLLGMTDGFMCKIGGNNFKMFHGIDTFQLLLMMNMENLFSLLLTGNQKFKGKKSFLLL